MSYHVVLTNHAQRDLETAADWWAENRSLLQAAAWYKGISEAIWSLRESASHCPLSPENVHFPYEIRELHYGLGSRPTHRAVFTIRGDIVIVLTIRHGAQDELRPSDVIAP